MSLPSEEEWLPVPGYEGLYEVSNLGGVRRCPRYLTPRPDARGYLVVTLPGEKGSRTHPVHRIVAAAFHGPRPDGLDIRHLNGERMDNSADNLAYGTTSDNMLDSVRHGTHIHAAKTHCPQGHEYTPENVYVPPGRQERQCKTCRRVRSRGHHRAPPVDRR